MPKRRRHEVIIARHFRWVMKLRGGVWCADGRSNNPNLGRHSLGTADYYEALRNLRRLDLVKAVELGRADRSVLDAAERPALALQRGVDLYLDYLGRPAVTGGASPRTRQRYRAVLTSSFHSPKHAARRDGTKSTPLLSSDI